MIPFHRILKTEIQKTKGAYGLAVAIALPVAVTSIIVLFYIFYHERQEGSTNQWKNYSRYIFQFYQLLYPLLAAFISFLICNIEHRSNGFKHLFTIPAPRPHFYLSKLLILVGWLTCSIIIAGLLHWAGGHFLHFAYPNIGFDTPNTAIAFAYLFKLYIVLLSFLSIHFALSIYWDNVIISVGSACFLLVMGMIAYRWEFGYLIPYTYPSAVFIDFFADQSRLWMPQIGWSIAYTLCSFSVGYFLMTNKTTA